MTHRPVRAAFCVAAASLLSAECASAAILTFTDATLYDATVAGMGRAVAVEGGGEKVASQGNPARPAGFSFAEIWS